MTYNIYSIRDVKTGFAAPFTDVNNDSAIRGFAFAFTNQSNILKFSPADFSLYRVGMFDSDSGHVTEILPEFVIDAMSILKGGVSDEE